MAKDPEKYRLWQHEVEPPKKSEQTVIVKVTPAAAAPTRTIASSLSAGGRAASAAGMTPDSGLARLLDNAHVTSVGNVFDEDPIGSARDRSLQVRMAHVDPAVDHDDRDVGRVLEPRRVARVSEADRAVSPLSRGQRIGFRLLAPREQPADKGVRALAALPALREVQAEGSRTVTRGALAAFAPSVRVRYSTV